MTRDDIIRMAKEAGWKRVGRNPETGPEFPVLIGNLERFAALVAAPLEEEIKRLRFCIPEGDAAAAMEYLAYCVEKAVAEEREACAKTCEEEQFELTQDVAGKNGLQHFDAGCRSCAEMIRKRGEI